MTRNEMLTVMVELYNDIPEGASSYHKMDILLGKIQRLGMSPPEVFGIKVEDELKSFSVSRYWEEENEEE